MTDPNFLPPSLDFSGKVVLVTGAGRGLGRAIAEAFAQSGARLALNDLTPINLDETAAHIRAAGGRAEEYIFDTAKKIPVQTMLQEALADFERIDILVNCAGVMPRDPFLDMDEWDWHRTIDVNLGGPFFMMQSVGRIFRQQGGGTIVNIAAAEAWLKQISGRAAFVASKAGLAALTRAAANELAAYNIRVNAVCPAGIETDGSPPETGSQPTPPAHLAEAVAAVLALCHPSNTATGQILEIPATLPAAES